MFRVEKRFPIKKKKTGLLILFVQSKHRKSSRGPNVVLHVSICVLVSQCFVFSSSEGEQAPLLLFVGYAPVT